MPPRFAYWTILAGGLPTSFRAADKDELLPTFRRLKDKHPDAEMKYFARGTLWDSPEQARLANAPKREQRGRDWRPGGEHRDPRQRFKDAKKARNEERRQQRWDRKHDDRRGKPPVERPHGDPLAPRPDRRAGVKGSRQGKGSGPFNKGPRGSFAKPQRPFRSSSRRPFERKQETPQRPPRPAPPPAPPPEREPPPGRDPKPEPPPRPSEPAIKPPGPPERGRAPRGGHDRRRRRDKH